MLKWKNGRQDGAYRVLTLLKTRWFDLHLIKIVTGGYVPEHVDPSPIPGKVHRRLNIHLHLRTVGGEFQVGVKHFGGVHFYHPRPLFALFVGRKSHNGIEVHNILPSEVQHRLTVQRSGGQLIVSFGWLRNRRG